MSLVNPEDGHPPDAVETALAQVAVEANRRVKEYAESHGITGPVNEAGIAIMDSPEQVAAWTAYKAVSLRLLQAERNHQSIKAEWAEALATLNKTLKPPVSRGA